MKRGTTDFCFVVGIDKPRDISSHDVVNRVRRIFGERRVGHTGTLDPLATGVLTVCVGPATRLDQYLTADNKAYQVRISFGVATDTDDVCGTAIRTAPVPPEVCDRAFVESYVASLVGKHRQLPPAYSAVKRDGVKSYEAARKGNVIQLDFRDIEVFSAKLMDMEENHDAESIFWDLEVCVSKGTYIRSLARDIGVALNTAAHVEELRRINSGRLTVEDCLTIEELEEQRLDAVLDPVYLLGFRMAFVNEAQRADIRNGKPLRADDLTWFYAPERVDDSDCGPLRGIQKSARPLQSGEKVSLVFENELVALYECDAQGVLVKPCCVFPLGVTRGKGL